MLVEKICLIHKRAGSILQKKMIAGGESVYVDYNIPVCDGLPDAVKEEIAILDKAYKEDDVGTYMLHEDSVDTYLKSCLETRYINEAQYFQMCRRFGWAYFSDGGKTVVANETSFNLPNALRTVVPLERLLS